MKENAGNLPHKGRAAGHIPLIYVVEKETNMNQIKLAPLKGAAFIVMAGIAFAIINIITQKLTSAPDWGGFGFRSTSDAFWQYFFALLFSLPFIFRQGLGAMKSSRPGLHAIRVILSALGVQAFVLGLANGVPIWQVIALVMTSPFFILLGAKFYLGETVSQKRWVASLMGFAGAMIVLQPWSSGFTYWSLAPIAAALLWGAASLLTKQLTATESPAAITLWLLLLLSPINFGLSVANGFEFPTGTILWLVLAAGFLQFLAQYFLTRAYAAADAAFLQPFDDLRLVFNIVAGFLVFGYLPEGNLWLGIALIFAGSAYLLYSDRTAQGEPTPA